MDKAFKFIPTKRFNSLKRNSKYGYPRKAACRAAVGSEEEVVEAFEAALEVEARWEVEVVEEAEGDMEVVDTTLDHLQKF